MPPSIVQQPLSRAAVPGGYAQFIVGASGTNLTYQWQMNQTNLTGATNSSLVNSNVQPADFGDYRAVVSNDGGAATSAVAQLSLAVSPTITAPAFNLGIFQMHFDTEFGPIYAVEYKESLMDPLWTELTAINGTGGPQAVTDGGLTNAARFYRLHLR